MASTTTAAPEAGAGARIIRRSQQLAAGTPGKLRLLTVLGVAASLVFGLLGYAAMTTRDDALGDAANASAQLILIQQVRTDLVEADSYATNAFLTGGLGNPAARAEYEARIASASESIALASGNGSGDAAAFGNANDALTTYTGLIEAARANNRQGYPVGVAYLKQASALLRADILPELEALVAANTVRVDDAFDTSRGAGVRLWIAGAIGFAVLAGVSISLSQMTRRNFNLGVVVAGGAVALVTVIGGAVLAVSDSSATDVRAGSYAATAAISQARIAAFDAKSFESLTLITRGSGQASETQFQILVGTGKEAGDPPAETSATARLAAASAIGVVAGSAQLDRWLAVHDEIRALDDKGDWDGAVALATGSEPDSANVAFAAFDFASSDALAEQAALIDSGLDDARNLVGPGAFGAAVLAALAAFAVSRGISTRLREYR